MSHAYQFHGLFSLHIRSMWETTVMHKQVSGWTVNFGPNSPVYPFLELKSRIPPPHFRKLQIWDDQSLLWNTPPFWKTSDLGWPKFTPKYPPPFWKTSDLRWPKFTLKYPPPPILENFRFGMTKVYSKIPPPPFGKLQIWDDQSLLRNTPPQPKIVQEFKSKIFRIPRVTTCGDFIQPG